MATIRQARLDMYPDLVEAAAECFKAGADGIMRTNIFSLHEDDLIDEAVKLMVEKRLKRVPVTDKDGRFKGMLTRDSILRAGAK